MNIQEKIKYLYNRHVKIHIEWGGTDLFDAASDMDEEIAASLLQGLLKAKSEEELELVIVRHVNRQMSREENYE